MTTTTDTKTRLEYLRGELQAERISYGELAELQDLVIHIDPSDTELLEAAGVPESPTLYGHLKAAGVDIESHESDLYTPDAPATRELCRKYGKSFSTFRNQVEGGTWLDIPFAFDPWWEARNTSDRIAADPPSYSVTYEVVTPESAEQGDTADNGIEQEDTQLVPLAHEVQEAADAGLDPVVWLCEQELLNRGATEPSSSPASGPCWYTTEGQTDHKTGAVTRYSVHFKGLTDEQWARLHAAMANR